MLKKLFTPKKEDVCPNCETACFATDVLCPNCGKTLDDLFEQLPLEAFQTKSFITIPEEYKLLLKWVLATVMGIVLGEVFLNSLTFRFVPLSLLNSKFDWFGIMLGVASGLATGFSVGVSQWLILRNYLTYGWVWIAATVLGMTSGNFIERFILVAARDYPSTLAMTEFWVIIKRIALFSGGLVIGLIQWVILQKFLSKTWIWVVTNGFGWALAIAVGDDIIRPMIYPCCFDFFIDPISEIIIYSVVGMLFGIITGVLLSWLLKQNNPIA